MGSQECSKTIPVSLTRDNPFDFYSQLHVCPGPFEPIQYEECNACCKSSALVTRHKGMTEGDAFGVDCRQEINVTLSGVEVMVNGSVYSGLQFAQIKNSWRLIWRKCHLSLMQLEQCFNTKKFRQLA